MTKNTALTALSLLAFLKLKPSDSFTLEQLINQETFGDRETIINALGYLVGKQVLGTKNGSAFWFKSDPDDETINEIRGIGEIKAERPKL